jgi:hypothetical protein
MRKIWQERCVVRCLLFFTSLNHSAILVGFS